MPGRTSRARRLWPWPSPVTSAMSACFRLGLPPAAHRRIRPGRVLICPRLPRVVVTVRAWPLAVLRAMREAVSCRAIHVTVPVTHGTGGHCGVDIPVLKLALSWPSVREVKQRLVSDGDSQLGASDVLPVSAGPFKPGLSHLAGVADRLLLARAMVAPTADAVAVRLMCVVAVGVAAALTAIGVADRNQRAHRGAPLGWAALLVSARRWSNRGSRYTRAPNPNRPALLVVVHPACRAKASPRACTRSDSRSCMRAIQLMSARLRFRFGFAVWVPGVDAVIAHLPALGGQVRVRVGCSRRKAGPVQFLQVLHVGAGRVGVLAGECLPVSGLRVRQQAGGDPVLVPADRAGAHAVFQRLVHDICGHLVAFSGGLEA